MSDAPVAPVREGEILDGKYRVDTVLGVGGMGIVVAATHVQLHTKVALKFLLPSALTSVQVIERFAREARAAVQIQSEHVARVSDVGTLPTGSPYMVMEFLEGGDLAELVAKSGPLPVETAVGYVLQACEAVAEAHSRGIVHRDLKPANLFLAKRHGRDPIVKVLDFGISKTNDAASGGLTGTAAIMGSPFYMAPEQMMSAKDVDARSDIWGLGVVLYELLTGRSPFAGDTMPEVVFMVTQHDPAPLGEVRADIPAGLAAAVARSLAKERQQRFQNVAELAVVIAPFGPPRSDISVERVSRLLGSDPGGTQPSSTSPPPIARAGQLPIPATSASWSQSGARLRGTNAPSKAPLLVGIGGVAALAAATLIVGLEMLGGSGNTSTASGVQSANVQGSAVSPLASSVPVPSVPPVATFAPESPAPPASSAPSTPTIVSAAVPARSAPLRGSAPQSRSHPGVVEPPQAALPAVQAAPASQPAPSPQPAPPPPQSTNRINMGLKE
jgi:serine/threonine-protein kinase